MSAFPAAEVEGSVPARFARVAASRGDALAIVAEGDRLTYGELDRRSDALAAAIADAGGALEAPVAVYAPAPVATILAMLATWKAGRFCVPLDPTLPPARIEEILRDADAGLVVAGGEPAFDVKERRVLRIEHAGPRRARASPLSPAITADSLACLLYTSGSTGEPKGVVRTHRNLLHRARCAVGSLGIGVEDRVSALHSPAFGAGLRDVLAALLGGATLLPFDVRRAGLTALADWIERERITVLCAVVTTLRHFLGSLDADRRFPSIRIVRLGSEALFREDVERLRARLAPDCVLVAGYGASEASGIVEFRIGPDATLPPGRVPAGYPLEGVEILILGEAGTPLPVGETGEIAVRSRYLSPGYWRRPDRTRALFLGEAIGDAPRVYRTGDLGRLGPDGCLELIGRLDHQVKIRGYLVHPDEIERRLLEHGAIRQAAVVGLDDGGGATRLVAYVVPSQRPAPAPAALRRFLQERLPDYMLPASLRDPGRAPPHAQRQDRPGRAARAGRGRARGRRSYGPAIRSSVRSRRSGRSCSTAAPSGPPTTSSTSAATPFWRPLSSPVSSTCTAGWCRPRRCSGRAPSGPSRHSCSGAEHRRRAPSSRYATPARGRRSSSSTVTTTVAACTATSWLAGCIPTGRCTSCRRTGSMGRRYPPPSRTWRSIISARSGRHVRTDPMRLRGGATAALSRWRWPDDFEPRVSGSASPC